MIAKRVLVTGGSGFLGSALVRRLVGAGHVVRVLDDTSRGPARRLDEVSKKIEFIQADVRDAAAVEKACRGMELVCHLAFVNGTEFFYTKPELVLEVAVKGITNVIDGCLKNKVAEFAFASSSEVYQTPPVVPTPENVPLVVPDVLNARYSYGGGKMIGELMTIHYGRKHFKRAVIFRPHNVYGPDMGWEHVLPQFAVRMKRLSEAHPSGEIEFPVQGTGNETRSFIHVDDFTDGLELVLTKGEHLGIYHIGTRQEISMKDLAAKVAKVFGRTIRVAPRPAAAGGTLRRCPDISKLDALGFKPKVSLEDGVKGLVDWYARHADEMPQSKEVLR